jgi:hypothetical protein
VVKRAKAATTERPTKKVALTGMPRGGSGKKMGGVRSTVATGGGEEELSVAVPKTRSEEPGLSVAGMEKLWSLNSGAQSQAKERGITPPALPVPIASFNI